MGVEAACWTSRFALAIGVTNDPVTLTRDLATQIIPDDTAYIQ